MAQAVPPALLGSELAGEALDDEGLRAWFASEALGYYALAGGPAADEADPVEFNLALNWWHALRHLGDRRFETCLALGPGRGGDYLALAPRVDKFVAIEPARAWWRTDIGGSPAEFREPTLRGDLELPGGSVDLACSFSVLHHIPNVGEVVAELGRVLAPGGLAIVREPILSMGDFRSPRPGLTRHERGIPHAMMDRFLAAAGLTVIRKSFCRTPGPFELAQRLGLVRPNMSRAFVVGESAISRLLAWNIRYWRPRLWHKAAPTTAYWVAEKR